MAQALKALLFGLAVALTPALAQAADLLPLRRGIFVLQSIPCNQRSNATVESFWGDRINSSRQIGVIKKVERARGSYRIILEEEGLDGEDRHTVKAVLVTHSPLAYTISRENEPATHMKWCATEM